MNSFDSFTLSEMSAGDIIDRAVRLYQRNFLALLRIVLAPSLVAYAGWILILIGWRNASFSSGDARIIITILLLLGGFLLWIVGEAAFYVALGGSSRSLVAHFFDGKPILARDVYRAAGERFWSLIGATFMVGLLGFGAIMIAYNLIAAVVVLLALMMGTVLSGAPEWAKIAVGVIFGVAVAVVIVIAILMICARIIYVPQILMVEGKGIFGSIGRSFSLAGGQIRRIAATILFLIYVYGSVVALLFFPVVYVSGWISPFGAENPPWYDIAWQAVWQLSKILLMPIIMIGCTLLYIDSRVRKEGFDVELLANRTLGQPLLPPPVYPIKPEQTSPKWTGPMWTPAPQEQGSFSTSILGLDDYNPAPTDPLPAPDEQIEIETAQKRCSRCSAETNLEDTFCTQCGSAINQQ
jgi:hypothetical protein